MSFDDSKYYNSRVKISDLRQRRSRTIEPVHNYVHGVVFSIGGSIFADRAMNYVWVHEWGAYASQEQAYLPPHMNVWEGAGVIMMPSPKPPYELEIIRVHVNPYPRAIIDKSGSDYRRGAVGLHAPNHQWPTEATKGPDPVGIWAPALQPLKSVASASSLEVVVGPLYYGDGASRAYFPLVSSDQTIDLTSYLPASGKCVRVLIYLDKTTGALDVASSPELTVPAIPAYPDVPYEGISSAYFYLESNYTGIDVVADYTDARRFLTEGSQQLPETTSPDQIIISNSTPEFVVGKIVTSGGNVVCSGGEIVWS